MHYNFWRNLTNLLYIYQLDNYEPSFLLRWSFSHLNWYVKNKRKELIWTTSVKRRALIAVIFQVIVSILFLVSVFSGNIIFIGICFILFIFGYTTIPWLILGNYILLPLILYSKHKLVVDAKKILNQNENIKKIAIAGSFGKTSMKEFLRQILSEKYNVAYTTGNLNTIWGNARCILDQVNSETDVFISEMGEYKIGEIAEISRLIEQNIAILTGINETHFIRFKNIDRTIQACFEVVEGVNENGKAYLNGDNVNVKNNIDKFGECKKIIYDSYGCNVLALQSVKVFVDHTEFIIDYSDTIYVFKTNLLGKHNVATLCVCIDIALSLGMEMNEIIEAISKIIPAEHRMSSKKINDMWLIDDSYNGNYDGFIAGANVIKELNNINRKIVITPGIVELGTKTEEVHRNIADYYKDIFDEIVLAPTAEAEILNDQLLKNGYIGKIRRIKNINEMNDYIQNFTLPNDIVILQNDVAENYL